VTPTSALAVTTAALCGLAALLATAGPRVAPAQGRGSGLVWRGRPALGPVSGAVVAAALLLALGAPVLLLPTVAIVVWTSGRVVSRARRDRAAACRRDQVLEACEDLLGELHAGRPPQAALIKAGEVWPELAPVAGAARLGGDVPAALRAVAEEPGAGAMGRIAGAWQLCATTGSGLADAIEQVLLTVRMEHEVAGAVRAELASARATARLLAVLPVLVLVMAEGIGADPWSFLLSTTPGLVCLGLGTALAAGGIAWLDRIADDVQGERR
jgi:tight adherence protein B